MKKFFTISFSIVLIIVFIPFLFSGALAQGVGQPCCSNPFNGRIGWSYYQAGNECRASIGMGSDSRFIECTQSEYCYPSGQEGICTPAGVTPTGVPTPPGGCNIGDSCCKGGMGQGYYCNSGTPSTQDPSCICEASSTGPGPTIPVYDPECTSPGRSGLGTEGVKTALGCLPVNPQSFISVTTPWVIYLGAGIAFLLGIFGSAMIVLSAGNPEKMQAGKEMITSAFGGLLLIIFAVMILKTIGVDMLGLF